MKRRSQTGRKPAKARQRKTEALKRGDAPNPVRSAGGKESEVGRFKRERDEALEQLSAASEVLKVISSSPGELQPVFQAMLANAVRICDAKFGMLFRYDNEAFEPVALFGVPPVHAEFVQQRGSFQARPGTALERMLRTKDVVRVADGVVEPVPHAAAKLGGARSTVDVPMLKDDVLIGAISIFRQEVRPFTDKQIELVRNFAAQAVIAIENARLLSELRQRTDDLSEALEQQTATSEVLRVISSSPGDLKPVFQAMLENATRICDAKFGILQLNENGKFRNVAMYDPPPALAEHRQREPVINAGPHSAIGRVAATKRLVHIADYAADPAYQQRDPAAVNMVERAGARTVLLVPMLKDDEHVGNLNIYRQEVRPFTERQIELLKNFAAQAVIAVENTRLLSELRESLQQQTATADVLKVISSSPGELKPVFQAMLENATRICEAMFGTLFHFDDHAYHLAAQFGTPPELAEFQRQRGPFQAPPGGHLDQITRTKQVRHTADEAADPRPGKAATLGGARSAVYVPMLKDDLLIGAIVIYRQEVRPFTNKQIDLVKNFAAQAVIAIENTRLLNELRQRTDDLTESLEQQTATSEVLSVISSSPGDLRPVFQAVLENAVRLCGAKFGILWLAEGDGFRLGSLHGAPAEFSEERWRNPFVVPGPNTALGRTKRTRQLVHIDDVTNDLAYTERDPLRIGMADKAGARTLLSLPMLKDNELVGAIGIYRQEVRLFDDKQIEILRNFAAQAVIAIENARLLNELRQRTDDLSESLEQQTATSEVLKVISSSPGALNPVFHAMLENATRICEAKFGVLSLDEGGTLRVVAMHNAPPSYVELRKREPTFRPEGKMGLMLARAVSTKRAVQIADVSDEAANPDDSQARQFAAVTGARSVIAVPMLKDQEFVGVITVFRQEARPFADKQVELLTNFAAQAVIAIENTRLLSELRQRTTDLTESLENLRTAQDRLVQTEKLASLGQLTAGIAHEIKNPLNFVNNFSSVSVELIDELKEVLVGVKADDKSRAEMTDLMNTLRDNLDKVVQHGKRADAIVKNMLLHSRQGTGEHRPVDINTLVEEALNLAYHGARAEKQGFNITLERSFDPAAGEVDLFPQEITRVLLNLISNGFYAAIQRKAKADGADYEPTLAAATRNLGPSVEIKIRDNGIGIPPEVKEKMFNPFFTTKPAGEGTGLGLSISHDIIVKQHGGSIEVDTKPGAFTEFRIVLPRSGASSTKSGEHA